jgi:chaperonin GroEL (HSP60 family)
MKPKTKFKGKTEFQRELLELVEGLLQQYNETWTVMNESLVTVDVGGYHFISQLIKPPYSTRTQTVLCSLLYKNIYNAELLNAGAGEIVFVSALTHIKEILTQSPTTTNENKLLEQWKGAMEKIKFAVEQSIYPVTKSELKSVVMACCEGYPNLGEACWEALQLAGLEGRVFIEDGNQDNFVIELKEGYTFQLKPYKFFLEKGKWDSAQCKVLVVDGFIESVSEIDHLLKEAHEKKQPMTLISHGFSEEVISTLYTNHQRKLLNVMPLRLVSDVSSLNVINDIGVVCGRDPVSSLKGELVSFVKYADLPVVKRVLVTEQDTTIENFKTRSAVFSQIKALLAKREENRLIEDLQNIMDGRIRSLSPNAVKLYLPEMSAILNDAVRIKLDLALRNCKSLLGHGRVMEYNLRGILQYDAISPGRPVFPSMVANEFEKSFFETTEDLIYYMKRGSAGRLSPLAMYTGILIGSKLALMLVSSAGVVEVDDS